MHSLLNLVSILFVTKTSTAIYPQLELQWMNESCIGGERGLLSTGLWLSLSASYGTTVCSSDRLWIEYNSSLPVLDTYWNNCSQGGFNVTFVFEQPEHGGGKCQIIA